MNTLEFLRLVLPEDGWHYLVLFQNGSTKHIGFESLETMATAITKYDKHPTITAYHACASYHNEYIESVTDDGKPKKSYRTSQNQKAAKAYWIDIDCGADKAVNGKGYATKKEAAQQIAEFSDRVGIAQPTMVSSGGGLHCYWPLSETVTPEVWARTANLFKLCLRNALVWADPSRTADFASILRPIGSHHKKDKENIREVKIIRAAEPTSQEAFSSALQFYAEAQGVQKKTSDVEDAFDCLGALPAYAKTTEQESSLSAHAYPEILSSIELIASECAQVGDVRDTGGSNYEGWRLVIGLAKYCTDGELVKDWSAQYPNYSEREFVQKTDTWNAGPSTCKGFEAKYPEKCAGCTHAGKITTPLVLGRVIPVSEVKVVQAVIDGKDVVLEIPEKPEGFVWDAAIKRMVRLVKTEDGIKAYPFANLHFYSTDRILLQDGTSAVEFHIHKPRDGVKSIVAPSRLIGAGPSELGGFLAAHELYAMGSKEAALHMNAYMKESINNLLHKVEQQNTHVRFGWTANKEGFVLGNMMHKADGTQKKVILSAQAKEMTYVFGNDDNSVEKWSEAVNGLYNHKGMEPQQYVIASSFGSILGIFGEDTYNGIPISLSSTKSGTGKTTVCWVALSAWGIPKNMLQNGDNKTGATDNALYMKLGVMNNIPRLFDEVTKADPNYLGSVVYAMSNGQEKDRVVATQTKELVVKQGGTWNQSGFLTSNNRMSSMLASARANSEAESMRFIEIHLDEYPMVELNKDFVKLKTRKAIDNHGASGRAFVRYVVSNLATVEAIFLAVGKRLSDADTVDDPKYRFYRQHAMATITAATILKKLGIVDFDVEAMLKWISTHLNAQAANVAEHNNAGPAEAVARMLSAMSQQIVTTLNYNVSKGLPIMVRAPDFVAGRYVYSGAEVRDEHHGKLYMSQKAVRDWCLTERIDLDAMLAWASSEGFLVKDASYDRFNLTRGTNLPAVQTRVYCFDHDKMQGIVQTDLKLVRPAVTEIKSASKV